MCSQFFINTWYTQLNVCTNQNKKNREKEEKVNVQKVHKEKSSKKNNSFTEIVGYIIYCREHKKWLCDKR